MKELWAWKRIQKSPLFFCRGGAQSYWKKKEGRTSQFSSQKGKGKGGEIWREKRGSLCCVCGGFFFVPRHPSSFPPFSISYISAAAVAVAPISPSHKTRKKEWKGMPSSCPVTPTKREKRDFPPQSIGCPTKRRDLMRHTILYLGRKNKEKYQKFPVPLTPLRFFWLKKLQKKENFRTVKNCAELRMTRQFWSVAFATGLFKVRKMFYSHFFACWFICILDLGESKSPPPKKKSWRERKSLTDRQIALLEWREEGDGKMFFDQLISISVFFPAAKPSGLRKVGVVMGGLVLLR